MNSIKMKIKQKTMWWHTRDTEYKLITEDKRMDIFSFLFLY